MFDTERRREREERQKSFEDDGFMMADDASRTRGPWHGQLVWGGFGSQ